MPDILEDLRAELDAAFERAETPPRRGRWAFERAETPPRRRRWAVPAGVLAVGVAAAVAALVLTSSAPPPATAAEALRAVAQVAQREPAPMPRDDQFYYVRSRATGLSMYAGVDPGHEHAATLVESDREIWISATRRGRMVSRERGRTPLTPADAGRIQGPQAPGGEFPVGATRGYAIGGERRLTRAEYLAFPTDPSAAYERIRAHVGEGGHSVEGQVFDAIGTALREHPAPAALRAALYRTLALVPGVTLIGTVEDRAGRTGTAVAFTEVGTRRELVFDPKTSELLAERQVLVDPARAEIDAPVGTVIGDVAYLERAVTDALE